MEPQVENAYDQMQYESHAYRDTHPEHLYTLATLFGLKPHDFRSARVLELGCASGGNLIPMAYNYPQATFIGIDLSTKQIDVGQKLISNLSLKNVALHAMSILDLEKQLGTFDYIICHGIYSWVDAPVRDKILSIFKELLNPQGVAYISYNTLPGWSMVKSIRDMMLYHAGHIQDPKVKAQQARALLHFIVEGLEGDQSSYADFLRYEIELLKKQPDSYLLHDHLEEINHPVYFYQLVEDATKQGLSYLSDAQLSTMFVGNLPQVFAGELAKVQNILLTNQYMDFIRNQRFRANLFCHQEVQIHRNLNTQDVEQFYLSYVGNHSKLTDEQMLENVEVAFQGHNITLTTSSPLSKWTMRILSESVKPIHYEALLKKVHEKCPNHTADDVRRLLNDDVNLLRLSLGGMIRLHSDDGLYTLKPSKAPKTTSIVLEQVKEKNIVTNQRHETVALSPLERMMIPLFDGAHESSFIIQSLVDRIGKGEFEVLDSEKNKIVDQKQLFKHLESIYLKTVEKCAHQALLI